MRRSAITAALLALGAMPLAAMAQPAAPRFIPVATTALPAMPMGDFDQLAADPTHDRLYVSAEDGAAVHVFDLRSGALIASGDAVAAPHKIAYDAAHRHVLVVDGADGSLKVLGPDLALIARVPVGAKADTGALDAAGGVFWVGSRDGDDDAPRSRISAISLTTLNVVRSFVLPARTLKGLIVDRAGHRLLVSMRDTNQIGVIHLDTGRIDLWSDPVLHKPVPLAYDPRSGLVFAGLRGPGELVALDGATGAVKARLPLTDVSDSMTFDPAGRRLYVSGDSGLSSFAIAPGGEITALGTDAAVRGKTSLAVPALHMIYVMRPRAGGQVAALTVFEIAP